MISTTLISIIAMVNIAEATNGRCGFIMLHIIQMHRLTSCIENRIDNTENRISNNEEQIRQLENRTSTLERQRTITNGTIIR